jgi:hypothetical protein
MNVTNRYGIRYDRQALWYDAEPKADLGPSGRRFGWVYFIDAMGLNLTKIGWSMRPEGRLRSLELEAPINMRLFSAFPGSISDEAALQRIFRDLRVKGEWFRHEGELQVLVSKVVEAYGPDPWNRVARPDDPFAPPAAPKIGLLPGATDPLDVVREHPAWAPKGVRKWSPPKPIEA